jgi:hypothetical protein
MDWVCGSEPVMRQGTIWTMGAKEWIHPDAVPQGCILFYFLHNFQGLTSTKKTLKIRLERGESLEAEAETSRLPSGVSRLRRLGLRKQSETRNLGKLADLCRAVWARQNPIASFKAESCQARWMGPWKSEIVSRASTIV